MAASSGHFAAFQPRRLVKALISGGLLVSSGATGLILLVGSVTVILTARLLGPSGRGALGLAVVWSWSLVVFTSVGLDHAFIFVTSREVLTPKRLWGRAITAAGVQGILGALVGELAVQWLVKSPTARVAVRISILFLPASLLMLYQLALMQGMQLYGRLNAGRMVQPLLWLTAVVGAFVVGFRSPTGLAFAFGISQLLGCLAAGALVRLTVGAPQLGASGMWSLLGYGSLVWMSGVSRSTNLRLDQLVLGALTTTTAIGLYAAGVSVAAVLTIVSTGTALVTLPAVARLDPEAAYRKGVRSAWLAGLAMAAGALLLWKAAPHLIPFMLGRRFDGSIRPFRVLVIAQVFVGMNLVLHETSNGLGHPGLPAVVEGIGAVTTVVLLVATVPTWGIMAAAWISLAVYGAVFLGLLVGVRLVRKTAGTRLGRMPLEEELTRDAQVSE